MTMKLLVSVAACVLLAVFCSLGGCRGESVKTSPPSVPSPGAGAASPVGKEAPQRVRNSIGMEFVMIPPGEFLMGSSESEADSRADELPQHRVRITRPFLMGVHEVTQEQFQQITGTKVSFFSSYGPGRSLLPDPDDSSHHPAEQVTWTMAADFCRKLSALPKERAAGRVYRLPTEAEWEYACRAGTQSPFHYGDSLSAHQANFKGTTPYGAAEKGPFLKRTTPVGSFDPNSFGLYDMHGNVWEWCLDWYQVDAYEQSSRKVLDDPTGPKSGTSRSSRGGGWYSDGRDCRSAFRYADHPDGIFYVLGLRVVIEPSGTFDWSSVEASGAEALTVAIAGNADPVLFDGEEWPRWRGVRGDGTWNGPNLPENWPDGGLPTLWRREIGSGYSGVAVSGGLVYTMDYRSEPIEQERLVCLDARTGDEKWAYVYGVAYGDLAYGSGPRVTPTVSDGRVYSMGALGHTFCLDSATGEKVWEVNAAKKFNATTPLWGFCSAPLIYENTVILHLGGQPDASVVALDRATGSEKWRSLADPAGYATPIIVRAGGVDQLILWTPTNINSVDPRNGSVYWSVPFEVHNGVSITTPIFRENIVLVSGYWEGSKAIRLGATPGVVEEAWSDRRNLRSLMAQGLYQSGYAYLLDKRNGLTCFEMRTGEKQWTDGNRMTPKGRNPQATMVQLAGTDRALVLNSEGDLIQMRLNPERYDEIGRVNIIRPAGPSQPIWAHPGYAGRCVYARSDAEIVCVALVPSS